MKNIKDELQRFLAETPPAGQVSVLHPYKEIVAELYVRNYTQEQIAGFFCRLNIEVSREAVGVFIRKHIAKKFDALRSKVNSPLSVNESTAPPQKEINDNKDKIEQIELPVMLTQQRKKFQFYPTGQSQNQEITP